MKREIPGSVCPVSGVRTDVKQQTTATLPIAEVDGLVGKENANRSPAHPRVREDLARQGIDLALPIIVWPDADRGVYCYRNRKEGDPDS
jgi:hypothetical protein